MRVFLTGANGFIGGAVGRVLMRGGHQIHALARSPGAREFAAAHSYKVIEGSLEEPETLETAVRDADAVVHCAATGDMRQGDVDSAATRALLDALRGTGKRFVYTSGCWVYGNTGDRPADEKTPLAPPAIVAGRVEVEREVIDAATARVHAIILRPGVVFGQRRGLPGMLLANVKDGAVQYVGDGKIVGRSSTSTISRNSTRSPYRTRPPARSTTRRDLTRSACKTSPPARPRA